MSRIVRLICFLLFLPVLLRAGPGMGIEVNAMVGKILKHTSKFRAPIPDHSSALELAWLKQTDGRRDWEQRRNYPLWGIGACYTHYGVDSVYGQVFGVYPMLQIPLIRGKSLEWTLRVGIGVGYATRHYERYPVWDTLNNMIGSSFNNFSLFATSLRYRLNSHWSLQTGLTFSHLSNGALKQPNLGINMYSLQLGLRYWPDGDQPERIRKDRPKLKNRILGQARLGIAFNQGGGADGPMYPTYLATVYASRRYNSQNKILLGADYSYHTNAYVFQRNNEINPGHEAENSWRAALFFGHEWLFGRMAFVAQWGFYLRDPIKNEISYQKLGYHYYIIKQEKGILKEAFLGVQLKTHLTTAELIEFGVGMGF
jgi:hypothetical protein